MLVLLVAGTICFVVVGGTSAIIAVELLYPDQDTTGATRAVSGIVNTLIGLLAGFLAGKAGFAIRPPEPPS